MIGNPEQSFYTKTTKPDFDNSCLKDERSSELYLI